ncbi:hypothetical protein L873DRAFT_1141393 [Choiromyces venosus 120613-1]|uniref:Zn(2)-C6 fungal-type domain-containing protein n=1 Tax=Choiromyces venosus 120613-1 TaxID=1336337 RepID=A0A3N4JJ10_9PEZI|nr:hypothetical protein L873DRAFT_1141393 [Choiromyces venosus 120613-1]
MGVTVQVFAANNSSYRGRKRAHRACDQCKKRRKRCLPPFENHERCAGCTKDGLCCSLVAMEPSQGSSSAIAGSPVNAAEVESERFTDKLAVSSDPRDEHSRFIGDLNPEAALRSATSNLPSGPSSSSTPALDTNEIGVWVSQPQTHPRPRKRRKKSPDSAAQPSPSTEPTFNTHYNNFLVTLNAFSLPPRSSVDALLSLYLTSVHPIYPLVDTHTINLFKTPDAIPPVLLQSILLVASRHPDAVEYLILSSTNAPLTPREFASILYTRITALLHAGEKDRIRLIRVYGLLSLHSADGPDGNEVASMNLCTAIHHAHSAGLHLKRGRNGGKGETELWWCLWGLDKLQAAINGRPVLVRGEDTSIDFPSEDEGTGVFRGMVRLAELLEKVIALYRPRKEGGVFQWEEAFPTFEQVVGEINCDDPRLISTSPALYPPSCHRPKLMRMKKQPYPSSTTQSQSSPIEPQLQAYILPPTTAAHYRRRQSMKSSQTLRR